MTPLLEKAIRAGCDPEYDGGIPCQYPQCHCQLSKRIELGLAAALADGEAKFKVMSSARMSARIPRTADQTSQAELAALRRHILGEMQ